MTANYGELFISKNGVVDSGIWKYVLGDVPLEKLKYGIFRLFKSSNDYSKYPPSAMEFRDLCYDMDIKREQEKLAQEDKLPKLQFFKREQYKKSSPEIAQYYINECFKLLGVRNND